MCSEIRSAAPRLSIPVAVVLEKKRLEGPFWCQPEWSLDAVLSGEHLGVDSKSGVKTADTECGELFLWSDYCITLYRDACERYWHALIGDKPQVYVVCCEDAVDGTVEPALVTLDYDEAAAYGETDGTVLSGDISPALYRLMEAFVLQHYKPAEFKKRKRKNWSAERSHD